VQNEWKRWWLAVGSGQQVELGLLAALKKFLFRFFCEGQEYQKAKLQRDTTESGKSNEN